MYVCFITFHIKQYYIIYYIIFLCILNYHRFYLYFLLVVVVSDCFNYYLSWFGFLSFSFNNLYLVRLRTSKQLIEIEIEIEIDKI